MQFTQYHLAADLFPHDGHTQTIGLQRIGKLIQGHAIALGDLADLPIERGVVNTQAGIGRHLQLNLFENDLLKQVFAQPALRWQLLALRRYLTTHLGHALIKPALHDGLLIDDSHNTVQRLPLQWLVLLGHGCQRYAAKQKGQAQGGDWQDPHVTLSSHHVFLLIEGISGRSECSRPIAWYSPLKIVAGITANTTQSFENETQEQAPVIFVVFNSGGIVVVDPFTPDKLHTIAAVAPLHTGHLIKAAAVGVVIQKATNQINSRIHFIGKGEIKLLAVVISELIVIRLHRRVEPLEFPTVSKVQYMSTRIPVTDAQAGSLRAAAVIVVKPLITGTPTFVDMPVKPCNEWRAVTGCLIAMYFIFGKGIRVTVHVDIPVIEIECLAHPQRETLTSAGIFEEAAAGPQRKTVEIPHPVSARKAVRRPELVPGKSALAGIKVRHFGLVACRDIGVVEPRLQGLTVITTTEVQLTLKYQAAINGGHRHVEGQALVPVQITVAIIQLIGGSQPFHLGLKMPPAGIEAPTGGR